MQPGGGTLDELLYTCAIVCKQNDLPHPPCTSLLDRGNAETFMVPLCFCVDTRLPRRTLHDCEDPHHLIESMLLFPDVPEHLSTAGAAGSRPGEPTTLPARKAPSSTLLSQISHSLHFQRAV